MSDFIALENRLSILYEKYARLKIKWQKRVALNDARHCNGKRVEAVFP
jgi:hypothetical protein